MNKEEILAMQAGDELDELIKRHVMGWKLRQAGSDPLNAEYYWYDGDELVSSNNECLKFSNDISAAWGVIDNLSRKGYLIRLNSVGQDAGGFIRGTSRLGDWHCNVRGTDGVANHVYETSASEAICKAALLAVIHS